MFDLIILAVLLISATFGFFRGATRELFAVAAFIVGVVGAILALPITTPIAIKTIHTEWIAQGVALMIVFLVLYIALRLCGAMVVKKLHQTALGPLDRAIGLGFGLIRALVILGVFNIVFHAATPPERTPKWVTGAKLYPLTAFSAHVLQAMAPRGSAMAGKVAPALERSLKASGDPSPHSKGDKPQERVYDPDAQKRLDDLVEKSL